MHISRSDRGVEIRATKEDTYDFAHYNPAGTWPCSALDGHGVTITLAANGDLIGGDIPEDTLSEELAAFIDYALAREEN